MPDTTTDTTPPDDINAQLQQTIAQLMPQQSYAPPPPVERSTASLLGAALGGGTAGTGLTPAEEEAAGHRALLNFGLNMLSASGYSHTPRTFGQVFAQGAGGAEQSLAGSEAVSMSRLAAQQAYAQQQQQTQLERIKAAIPLLQMQQTAARGKALLGGGPAPGTSIATAGAPAGDGTYEGDVGSLEGTGKSATSTAFGTGQFIEPTWNSFVQANPDLFKGMTPEQILAARANPAIANQAITWLAQQNAPVLAKAGVAPSGPSLALAHRLGPAAAAAVMQAPDTAPVPDVLTASIGKDNAAAYIKANPDLGTATAGDLKRKYAGVHTPGFLGSATAARAPGALTPPAPQAAPPAPSAAPSGGPPAAPPVITDQPPLTATVAGPGAPTGGAVAAVSPGVPGDVNAIIRGMTAAGASPTTLQPPGPPGAPPSVQTAGPGAPTAPAPAEALPLPDAAAKAAATKQNVPIQGGNGWVVTPDGRTLSPQAAAAAQAPAPSPAQAPTPPAVYVRQPVPADIQRRIDHPETPAITEAYRNAIAGATTTEQQNAAIEARTTAIEKARADAITQGEAWQTKQQEQWQQDKQKQIDIQAAKDAAAAKAAQEEHVLTLTNQNARINKLREEATAADGAALTSMRTGANNAEGIIRTLQMLRGVEADMPETGSSFYADHPNTIDAIANNLSLSPETLKGLSNMGLFQKLVSALGTQMSEKAAVGPGTARSAEINQNLAALPSLASDHNGRIQAMAFIQNMAQDQITRANEADDYYYTHDHPNKELDLHQSLYKFPQTYEQNHPTIIPRAPATGPTENWMNQNGIKPGMIYERPVPQLDPLTRQPARDARGRPIVKWVRRVRGEDE